MANMLNYEKFHPNIVSRGRTTKGISTGWGSQQKLQQRNEPVETVAVSGWEEKKGFLMVGLV